MENNKTGEKNKGGRPTKYYKDLFKKVDEYLESIKDQEKKLPTLGGFALYIGTVESTIYEWKKKYKRFSESLEKILSVQKEKLIMDGIYNKDANSTIVKLLLQNNHGMREKTDTDITSEGKQVVGFNFIVPDDNKSNSDNKT